MEKKIFTTMAAALVSAAALAQAPAFPGAEGHGRYVTGGRGGRVVHVTNLNDSGTGSFREAVKSGKRIIVFDVAGVIALKSDLKIADNITILGQTAPSPGITLRYYTVQPGSNNIIRFLRIRRGQEKNINDGADATWQRNKTICKNVSLWAYQDTYVSNNQNGKFYFEDGILRGRTDYLCGKGDVYYNNVELWICEKGGYLAVPSQPKKYGYIFKDCTIKDATEAKDLNGNYALGRPWGKGTPIALYIDTKMEAIPSAAGWNEMSGGYPKRFAEYNSYTSTGSVVDLKDRKKVYDAYDSKDGDNYVNRRNETAGDPILAAEEAAFYTVENIMGQDDDWDPTAATEQASAPTNVKLNGTTLAWDNNDYALLWAVCKNGKVVDFTITPSYIVDDASATWSVRAANEMGGLSEATVVGQGTGIHNIAAATDAAVIKTAIYAADGTQLSNLQKGINIIVKTLADGSKKTSKVIVK